MPQKCSGSVRRFTWLPRLLRGLRLGGRRALAEQLRTCSGTWRSGGTSRARAVPPPHPRVVRALELMIDQELTGGLPHGHLRFFETFDVGQVAQAIEARHPLTSSLCAGVQRESDWSQAVCSAVANGTSPPGGLSSAHHQD